MITNCHIPLFSSRRIGAQAQDNWQADWDKTLKAAEQEGQVTYSGCGSHEYLGRVPKEISQDQSRVGGRLLLRGDFAHYGRAARGKIFDRRCPFRSHFGTHVLSRQAFATDQYDFILPEVKDTSKWWLKKHHYSDPEGKYLFVPAASVYVRFASYHTALVNQANLNPTGIC